VNNIGFTVNPLPTTALDTSFSLDLVILGGDCKLYTHGTDLATVLNGQLRVQHDYFGSYSLDLQPDSHTGSLEPSIASVPFPPGANGRGVTSLSDRGDASEGWTIHSSSLPV